KPVIGRLPSEEDVRKKKLDSVISYGYWQRRYGGSLDVLGKPINHNGAASEIVGVLPQKFGMVDNTVDLWVSHALVGDADAQEAPASRKVLWQLCVARLRPGVSIAAAQTQADAMAAQLAAQYPEINKGRGAFVEPLSVALRGGGEQFLFPLFGAVGFVLLIAC